MTNETDCLANRIAENEQAARRGAIRADREQGIEHRRALVAGHRKALRRTSDPERRETLQMAIRDGEQAIARQERQLADWLDKRR